MIPFLRQLFLAIMMFVIACKGPANRTWTMYKADESSSSYSPFDQVNVTNVHQLKQAWVFDPNDLVEGGRMAGSQCNPVIVDDVMYVASAQRTIFALEAATGALLWSFDPYKGKRGGGSFRGVTYWEKGNDKRILFTAADHLFAVNARTGQPILSFGDSGKVSMNRGMRDDASLISIKPTSPGIVYKDLIILGNEVSELYGAQPGYIRAYNVVNGKLAWTFHTVPLPGEFGYDTWPKDAWKYAGGANSWGGMSIDSQRGMVFLSTGSPSYDFYGADRKGSNLFGNCVIALEAATGKRVWHYQTIHHDLWYYDLPCPPNLVTITRDGKKIDAVAQASKVGFLYVLDRETGEPLFPVEERPVPPSDVPGEQAWPTQPFPLKPTPFARQHITEDDLADFSTSSNDSLKRIFRSLRYDGLFTPPSTKGSLNVPGTIGGAEWGGAAYDPESGVMYLKSNEAPEVDRLLKVDNNAINASASGEKIYTTYCVSCHKQNRQGEEPLYPSLVNLKVRMTEAQALERIRKGAGKMPPFEALIRGNESALIDFLFDKRTRENADIAEIRANAQSTQAKKTTQDTSQVYLNTAAYALLKDNAGRPFLKPPFATLNAIDLNTGEYLWKVPAGNIKELQQGNARTGATGSPGPIVTKGGLIFLGGTRNKMFEAYDKNSGKLLWEVALPGIASSTPATYSSRGKQFIVVSVGASDEHRAGLLIAFALDN